MICLIFEQRKLLQHSYNVKLSLSCFWNEQKLQQSNCSYLGPKPGKESGCLCFTDVSPIVYKDTGKRITEPSYTNSYVRKTEYKFFSVKRTSMLDITDNYEQRRRGKWWLNKWFISLRLSKWFLVKLIIRLLCDNVNWHT